MSLGLSNDLYLECADFLYHESELLDAGQLQEWLKLLAKDIDYRVPIRVTKENSAGSGFSKNAYFMKEDWGSLSTRIKRLGSEYSWSENPQSRIRRFVTNIRTKPARKGKILVQNNLMLFRSSGDSTSYDLICGERRDELKRIGGQLRLSKRLVLLDHTVLPTHNLSIFL